MILEDSRQLSRSSHILSPMREPLAIACAAATLWLGFATGVARVHEATGHPDEPGARHLDHVHRTGHLPHDRPAEHDDGDAIYLSATAAHVGSSALHPPVTLPIVAVIDPPPSISHREDPVEGPPRDPPRTTPRRLRAPPA
jgi:hypothetical protein